MTNTLKMTSDLFNMMQPKGGKVYKSTSLPSIATKEFVEWSNNDEQFIIKLDLKTKILTGHFYDWNEETQAWDDANDVPMDWANIEQLIISHNLILA